MEHKESLGSLGSILRGRKTVPGYTNFLWGVLAARFYERWGNEGVYVALEELRKEGLPDETYRMLKDVLER